MKKIFVALLAMFFLATSVWAQGTGIVPMWATTGYDNTGIKVLRGPVDSTTSLRLDTMNVMLDFRDVWVAGDNDSMVVAVIVDTTASNGVAPSVDVDIIPVIYNSRMQSSVALGAAVAAIDSCKVGVASSQYVNTVIVRAPISRLAIIRVRTTQISGGSAGADTIGTNTVKAWCEAPME